MALPSSPTSGLCVRCQLDEGLRCLYRVKDRARPMWVTFVARCNVIYSMGVTCEQSEQRIPQHRWTLRVTSMTLPGFRQKRVGSPQKLTCCGLTGRQKETRLAVVMEHVKAHRVCTYADEHKPLERRVAAAGTCVPLWTVSGQAGEAGCEGALRRSSALELGARSTNKWICHA